jgi:predicted nucleic acid-binding protein
MTVYRVGGTAYTGVTIEFESMKERVYIETSVVSYLTSRMSRDLVMAARQELTRQWWAERACSFDLFVSELVLSEARLGDSVAAQARLEALVAFPVLSTSAEAVILAEAILSDGAFPKEAGADALHIAIAAANGVDYLLTWNCKHLANASHRYRVERVVEAAGFVCPVICTPDELMEGQT